MASRRLAVIQLPSHTTALRFAAERLMTPLVGASRGRVCSLPGVTDNRENMEIPGSLQLRLYRHQRNCCCCGTLLYRCSTSWVGRLVRRWVIPSVGGWTGSFGGSVYVDGRVCSWLWVFDVFHTFVFWNHGGFTVLSQPLVHIYTSFAVRTHVIMRQGRESEATETVFCL